MNFSEWWSNVGDQYDFESREYSNLAWVHQQEHIDELKKDNIMLQECMLELGFKLAELEKQIADNEATIESLNTVLNVELRKNHALEATLKEFENRSHLTI